MSFYKNILLQHIAKLNTNVSGLPILISGMASSSIGIKNIPYGNLPFDLSADQLSIDFLPKDQRFNHDLYIISGLKTNNDAMRGEETILFGCDTNNNDGIYIFPGTHSKHVLVKGNKAIDVKTYMTGEMFDLLTNKSMLSSSVVKNDDDAMGVFFKQGVMQAKNGSFLHDIFSVRFNDIFRKLKPVENYHYLSGILIGAELKDVPVEMSVFMVSENRLLANYLSAAEILDINNVKAINADEAIIRAHLQLAGMFFN